MEWQVMSEIKKIKKRLYNLESEIGNIINLLERQNEKNKQYDEKHDAAGKGFKSIMDLLFELNRAVNK